MGISRGLGAGPGWSAPALRGLPARPPECQAGAVRRVPGPDHGEWVSRIRERALLDAQELLPRGDGPLREDLPAVASGRKGRTRAEMAAQLLPAHRNGQARAATRRASAYIGPQGTRATAA